ncbi:MAG: (2Fe-2S)-binding protein [Deltaproteobacteria bacterium]|nr:(2Fe-2S)-binding protein [Deltaproteobacteria bacterium]
MELRTGLVVNGRSCPYEPGETILYAAERAGIEIPTLCHFPRVASPGTCGVCVVEIKGRQGLVPACSTKAAPGMEVFTESARVVEARREVISAMLATGNHNCAARGADDGNWADFQLSVQKSEGDIRLCPAWGDCRLQDLAYRYQANPGGGPQVLRIMPVMPENPFFRRDYTRCIRCGRCVTACNMVQVNMALEFDFSAHNTGSEKDFPIPNELCVHCGECVQACPVGALVYAQGRIEKTGPRRKRSPAAEAVEARA